ncbi:hypothetical protein CGCSCA4_v003422 [Colletotrichum siamense]|uniref:Uncharacterized protein n=1 Tax=Colletotrichum siamense TaxID=690259 RepID=A0A9P5K897_COLSI|nr:hypothetical protein CGCSCA4_v003422 [Colletotrichum siamense]KAF4861359.1 hypothetical protein CGCSCA1_v014950 [Colletotrichum siamense]KAF4863023.1 hypothetical protein CGCSCA2_v003360 [Colletotrichum siamense]
MLRQTTQRGRVGLEAQKESVSVQNTLRRR